MADEGAPPPEADPPSDAEEPEPGFSAETEAQLAAGEAAHAPRQFDELVAGFEATRTELQDKGDMLSTFREEYDKLYTALKKSHVSEQRMVKRTQELLADISVNQEKISKARAEDDDAQAQKKRVQADIEAAWASVAESHKVEAEKRQRVNELKSALEVLKTQLETGSGWSEEQEQLKEQLLRQREELTRELETKAAGLETLRSELAHVEQISQDREEEKQAADGELQEVLDAVEAKRLQSQREQRRKDRLDRELQALKTQVETAVAELEAKQGEDEQTSMDRQLREAKHQMDVYLREFDQLFRKTHKLNEELEDQIHSNQVICGEIKQLEQDHVSRQADMDVVVRETRRTTKLKDLTARKIQQTNAEKARHELERDQLRAQIQQISTYDIQTERKEGELLRKQIDDLQREREILNKKLIKAGERTKQSVDLLKINGNTHKNLENEIAGYRAHVKQQREMIEMLVQDRERYEADAEAANQKYYTALEEVKLQELQLAELQKKIIEGESRLKQQQNLYEAVRSDRNLYSKNLIESTEEIAEMKRKFKIMNHQIEQLKEEITAKDHALVKEHFDRHKVDKEKESLRNELTKLRKQIQSSEQIISNQESEIQKLSQIIQEADEERTRQEKEYDAVINERDILGSQLIARNEELGKLYEKIKIQKSTLAKGEAQYNAKARQIAEFKNRIAELNRESEASIAQVANISELRNEVYRLERELLQERTKIKALSEELERPLNVHRWRKLEGSDPQRYDMIRKIHRLQKQLIAKTEEVVEKDLLIQEKEKLYVELKNILARQPGPEVAEQLTVYQQNLKEKKRQMRAMNSELNMFKAQVNEYKHDIERLANELGRAKRRYFAQMRERTQQQQQQQHEADIEAEYQAMAASMEAAGPPVLGPGPGAGSGSEDMGGGAAAGATAAAPPAPEVM